eukprot:gene28185-34033_t
MVKRGAATEGYAEELAKVEQEISTLQIELSDAQKMNDELTKKIDKKEKELNMKEDKLHVMREKNHAELEQLQLEFQLEREKYNHEINFHESEVAMLRINKQRMEDLQTENERLQVAIVQMEEQIKQESQQHALSLHDMNKNMRLLRLAMESKLRRELTGLDISFQKEAFDSLHERQKQAMFENAKLKDEVALQGVGIANLSARLARQKIQYDKCMKQLNYLNAKSFEMRERLSLITQRKNELNKIRDDSNAEMERLMGERQRLLSALKG